MTRAEAIDELCRLVSYIPIMLIDTVPKHQKDRFVRALKVGINSLQVDEQYDLAMEQAEPTGDLISRQAVIDLISKFVIEIHSEGGRDLNAHTNDVLRQILRNIGSDRVLPPVNPQEPKTIQEKQAESEKYAKAFDDGYEHGYSQARFDYEQEPKWIPVSERLPEFTINNTVSEDVLVFDGVDIRVGEYRKGKYLNGAGYWRVYGYDLEEYVDVIAWMPLPKPYEPQESEEEDADSD